MKKLYLKNNLGIFPLDMMHHVGDIKSGLFSVKERWERLFPDYEVICVPADFEGSVDDGLIVDGAFIPLEVLRENENVVYEGKLVVEWSKNTREREVKGVYCKYLYEFMLNNQKIFEFDITLKDLSNYKKEGEKYIHPSAYISTETIMNDEEGPIIIEENVNVRYFSVIEGPVYVGSGTLIERATIHGGTYIGKINKLSGEIEESIFMDYVNKHHYGFIGHSVIGEWVNLGAGTTNSDLKNNYSYVKLKYKGEIINTNSLKVGCFIGDHVKTGIGTMINTGTIIGSFSNVFGYTITPKYIEPFSWGKESRYNIEKLLETIKKVMKRRNVVPSEEYLKKIEEEWKLRG